MTLVNANPRPVETYEILTAVEFYRIRARASRQASLRLENLLEARSKVAEVKEEGTQALMQLYDELADAMLIHPRNVTKGLHTIREYDAGVLRGLIKRGLGFGHIQSANELAEIAHKTPLQLMTEAVELGDGKGKVMTVKQLEAFALGENVIVPEIVKAKNWLDRLGELPNKLKWLPARADKFKFHLDAIRELMK